MDKNGQMSFEDFVNTHYEQQIKNLYEFTKVVRPESKNEPEKDYFELGFTMGIQWIGSMLGLELAMPPKEQRDIIDRALEGIADDLNKED